MSRDFPECATLEEATHQAPPGYFAVESEETCVGCAFADADGSNCGRHEQVGAGADDKYPCEYDPNEDDTDDAYREPTVYFQFKPLSEWKFGNEEEENP
jgi:hypothetical protein